MLKQINQISEQAFLLDFGSEINIQINKHVISFANYVLKQMLHVNMKIDAKLSDVQTIQIYILDDFL